MENNLRKKSTLAENRVGQAAAPLIRDDVEKGSNKSISDSKLQNSTVSAAETSQVVDWDGEDDPENPLNWSRTKKWSTILLVSYITFVT